MEFEDQTTAPLVCYRLWEVGDASLRWSLMTQYPPNYRHGSLK